MLPHLDGKSDKPSDKKTGMSCGKALGKFVDSLTKPLETEKKNDAATVQAKKDHAEQEDRKKKRPLYSPGVSVGSIVLTSLFSPEGRKAGDKKSYSRAACTPVEAKPVEQETTKKEPESTTTRATGAEQSNASTSDANNASNASGVDYKGGKVVTDSKTAPACDTNTPAKDTVGDGCHKRTTDGCGTSTTPVEIGSGTKTNGSYCEVDQHGKSTGKVVTPGSCKDGEHSPAPGTGTSDSTPTGGQPGGSRGLPAPGDQKGGTPTPSPGQGRDTTSGPSTPTDTRNCPTKTLPPETDGQCPKHDPSNPNNPNRPGVPSGGDTKVDPNLPTKPGSGKCDDTKPGGGIPDRTPDHVPDQSGDHCPRDKGNIPPSGNGKTGSDDTGTRPGGSKPSDSTTSDSRVPPPNSPQVEKKPESGSSSGSRPRDSFDPGWDDAAKKASSTAKQLPDSPQQPKSSSEQRPRDSFDPAWNEKANNAGSTQRQLPDSSRAGVETPKEEHKSPVVPAGGFSSGGGLNRSSISDHEVKNILGQVSLEPGKGQGAQAEVGFSNLSQKVAASAAQDAGQRGELQRAHDQAKDLRDLQQKDWQLKDAHHKDAQQKDAQQKDGQKLDVLPKDLAQRQQDRAHHEQVTGAIKPELGHKFGDHLGQKADAHGHRHDEKGHDAAVAKNLGQQAQGLQTSDVAGRSNIPGGKEIQAGKDLDHNIRPEATNKTSTVKPGSSQNVEDFGIQPFILPPRAISPGTPSGGTSMVDVRSDNTTKTHTPMGQDITGDRRVKLPVREGETLEQIAERRFGDSRFVGLLATINPTSIKMITDGNRQVAVIVSNEIILPSKAELDLYVKTSFGRKPEAAEIVSGSLPLGATPVRPMGGAQMPGTPQIPGASQQEKLTGAKPVELTPAEVKVMLENDIATKQTQAKDLSGGRAPHRAVAGLSNLEESKTTIGKEETIEPKNEKQQRAANDPLVSDWMQVRYINSNCRIVVADPGQHASVFSIKLQLRIDDRWLNIASYEFSRSRGGMAPSSNNGHSVRYLYFRDGSRRAFQLDLPEATIREMAIEDFTKHWHSYQKAYLFDDTRYL